VRGLIRSNPPPVRCSVWGQASNATRSAYETHFECCGWDVKPPVEQCSIGDKAKGPCEPIFVRFFDFPRPPEICPDWKILVISCIGWANAKGLRRHRGHSPNFDDHVGRRDHLRRSHPRIIIEILCPSPCCLTQSTLSTPYMYLLKHLIVSQNIFTKFEGVFLVVSR
jgi:hypothetical protein